VSDPTARATSADPDARSAPAGDLATAGRARGAPRAPSILLVDDRPENLLALEAILEPLGHRLVRAGSADEALRHVLREPFAVILLDVQMPGTDGIETARLIKQRTRSEHVPIIFLTALDHDRRHVTLGYESGAVDYLFKPLDPDLLRAKVAAFVEIDRLREALAEQHARRFADLAVRESEERFRLVQQATNDVIWDWDLGTNGLRWNELAASVFRVPAGEIPDDVEWWFRHIHPDDRARVVAGIHAVIDAGADAAWSAEYRFELGDGSYRTFLDRGYVARNAAGEPVRMIGAMQDVTQRVRAREAAEAAQAAAERARVEAESASRLKSEFLATMSHEFRTPLNAILGYAQLLDMGVLGPATTAQHAHLERLQASARHLLRLVDDVLDVAKVDADRLDVRRDTLMTGAAVAAAVTLVHPQATAKGVRLLDLGSAGPGVPYVGDEHRVRQILVNLLANAVKFTPAGGEVTIVCDLTDEPDPGTWRPDPAPAESGAGPHGWVFVRVDDTGPGIAPDLLGRLFDPFVQGDGALTRAQGGTGLGLAISRRLARVMGGDLTVRNRPGGGATFALWLPGAQGAPPDAARAAPARSTGRTPPMGMAAISDTAGQPLDDTAFAVLHALSVRLASEAETIAERYVGAIREDGRFPGAGELPAVQLRDHATPFVGLLASQLMAIGETRGQAAELLGDGGHVQRLMAELHGAQRHRLGWSEADIERETPLLLAEFEQAIRGALDAAATAGAGDGAPPGSGIPDAAVRAAAQYAADVARQILDQATRTAVRSYRFAKASDAP
jgi:PAS domain S-box-containing protein